MTTSKHTRWEDLKRKHPLPPDAEQRACERLEQELLELNLRSLRETIGKTQEELAAVAEMTQPQLSKAERREDHLVSTLRRIVQALGGNLEVYATFDHGRRVKLTGV
jgi:hypothetical protein